MIKATIASRYGWSLNDINQMDFKQVMDFYRAANILQARENLLELNISDYPRMDKNNRRKFFNSIKRIATSNDNTPLTTTEDFAKFFERKLGNGG